MKEFILPCRDLVVQPGITVPVYIDNTISISCIEAAATSTQRLILVPQHCTGYPTSANDLYEYGTIGDVAHVLRMPDGAIHAIVRTTDAVKLTDISVKSPYNSVYRFLTSSPFLTSILLVFF